MIISWLGFTSPQRACQSSIVVTALFADVDAKTTYTPLLLILKILHDLNILWYHNSQRISIRYLGSCRIFSIHRMSLGLYVGFIMKMEGSLLGPYGIATSRNPAHFRLFQTDAIGKMPRTSRIVHAGTPLLLLVRNLKGSRNSTLWDS